MLTVLFGKLRTEAAGSLWLQPRVTAQRKQAVRTLASCLCRAATTTRSSRTRGPWATPWQRPRTHAGSVKSSSRDAPSLLPGLEGSPLARPELPPSTSVPPSGSQCEVAPTPAPEAAKGGSGVPPAGVSDAPGVGSQQRIFGNFPAMLGWHRKNRCARTFPLHEKHNMWACVKTERGVW